MKTSVSMAIVPAALTLIFLSACASRPVLPDTKKIKVTREAVDKDCQDLGNMTGRVASKTGTPEQALEDLKTEAARRGATHVLVREYSALGTAVSGTLYACP
jgi:hypothetical protein